MKSRPALNDAALASPSSSARLAGKKAGDRLLLFFLLAWTVAGPAAAAAEPPTEPAATTPAADLGLRECVRLTLENHPEIRIRRAAVENARGVLQQANGRFDWNLGAELAHADQRDPLSRHEQETSYPGLSETRVTTTSYRLGLAKQLPFGTLVSPGIRLVQTGTDPPTGLVSRASIDFTVTQPLLRGRGAEDTAGEVRAAEIERQASLFDLRHALSSQVLETILAYWTYHARERIWRVQKESEDRTRSLLYMAQRLIETDERPAADLKWVTARIVTLEGSRVAAEQDLLEARQQLALAMGLSLETAGTLPFATDGFPPVPAPSETPPAGPEAGIEQAIRNRADILASRAREEAARALLTAARLELRPALDLILNVGYAGLDEGGGPETFFTPYAQNLAGLNFSAAVEWAWPMGNDAAQGLRLQRASAYEQAILETQDLARNIRSRVIVARSALATSRTRVGLAQQAVDAYILAVEDEKKLFKSGLGDILDVILTEDALTNARNSEVETQFTYASALAELRYETGGLVRATTDDQFHVDLDGWTAPGAPPGETEEGVTPEVNGAPGGR